ncbi:MAG: restriction endonuclease [Chloroflexi bacterium]|nr:restriction endonuclease [Chloroflexota bacterium]
MVAKPDRVESFMEPTFPPHAVVLLKRALARVYWYKGDLRTFLRSAGVGRELLEPYDWTTAYKSTIASGVVDSLIGRGDQGVGPLRHLTKALLDLPNLDHLRQLNGGTHLVEEARSAIEALRAAVTGQEPARGGAPNRQATRRAPAGNADLPRLRADFARLATNPDHSERGIQFERFLTDLFTVHDLQSRGSFRNMGEQIDGAFVLDNNDFLLEAKWEKDPTGAADLDAFSRKVERKLENTLGLFVSLNGFAEPGLKAFSSGKLLVILMDGEDLAAVLEGLVDFVTLLRRKRSHAAQTGDPFFRARDLTSG